MVEWDSNARAQSSASVSAPDSANSPIQFGAMIAATPRPFVLMSEREISVLRRGLTKDGWKRSLYLQPVDSDTRFYVGAGLLSSANRILESQISIPERSGHFHLFYCECGTALTIPDDMQVAKEYVCPSCGKAFSGERYDACMRYVRHRWLASGALSLALVYGIEKDKAYSDKATEILLKYAEAYPGPHTSLTEGGMMHQSLCEAVWAIPLAQAYDLIYYSRSISEKQREFVEDRLFRPIAEGLKTVGIPGNWGAWHLSAVGVIGLAIKDPALVRYALDAFEMQMAEQLGDDGLWPESVHTYHFYALSAFVHFAEACYRAGIDIYNWEVRPGKSLKAMFTAPLQYMYPSLRLPAINDGWYDSFLPIDLYEIAYRRWSDPAFAWVLKRAHKFAESPINHDQQDHRAIFVRDHFYAFLFGRDLPGRSGAPSFKSSDFPVLGICTLRNGDDMMATLDYGPFLGHGHLDKLGFTLYADDTLLVPDYGTPGYGSGVLGYYQGTSSHNTVVVDGRSQEPSKRRDLAVRYSGSFLQFAEVVADDHYPGVTQSRRLLLLGNACLINDELTSETEHDYDWFMRVEGEPELIGKLKPAEVDCSAYPFVDFSQTYEVGDLCRIDWKCEHSTLAFALWTGLSTGAVAMGLAPAETAARRVPVVMCRQHGLNARFTALLVPSQARGIEMSIDGSVVRLADQERVDYVHMKGIGSGVGPIRTDGEVAAVRTEGDEIIAVALVKGTWIKWMDEPLLECQTPVDCVEICFKERHPNIKYCCDTAGVVKLRTNSRAMRVNGHRTAAANLAGQALLRVTPQMLGADAMEIRS